MPVKASVSARYNIQLNLEVGWSGQLMSCHGWANAIGLLAENSSPQDTQVGRRHLLESFSGLSCKQTHYCLHFFRSFFRKLIFGQHFCLFLCWDTFLLLMNYWPLKFFVSLMEVFIKKSQWTSQEESYWIPGNKLKFIYTNLVSLFIISWLYLIFPQW